MQHVCLSSAAVHRSKPCHGLVHRLESTILQTASSPSCRSGSAPTALIDTTVATEYLPRKSQLTVQPLTQTDHPMPGATPQRVSSLSPNPRKSTQPCMPPSTSLPTLPTYLLQTTRSTGNNLNTHHVSTPLTYITYALTYKDNIIPGPRRAETKIERDERTKPSADRLVE